MKVRTSKQPKQAKPATQVKDLEPKEDPKGGGDSKVNGGFGWDRIAITPIKPEDPSRLK